MHRTLITAILAATFALPTLAQAQNARIPVVRIPATVTGIWVLDPLSCPDIREDIRDARRTTSRADRREDRRDQRLIDCPASSYRFVPNPGQAPNRPIRVRRDGTAQIIGGGQPGYGYTPPAYTPPTTYQTPTYAQPQYQAPTYAQPQYQAPTYNTQPQYQAPAYNTQPQYTAPTYNTQPTYSQPTYQ